MGDPVRVSEPGTIYCGRVGLVHKVDLTIDWLCIEFQLPKAKVQVWYAASEIQPFDSPELYG